MRNNVFYIIQGNASLIKQSINIGTKLLTNDKIILLTNDNELKMPSIIGWTREEAESLFKLINHKYTIEGYGYITSQSIPKNTIINLENTIKSRMFSIKDKAEEVSITGFKFWNLINN